MDILRGDPELHLHAILWIGPTANHIYFLTIRRTFAFEPKYVLGCSCDATVLAVPVEHLLYFDHKN
jgi:hypothetical protein